MEDALAHLSINIQHQNKGPVLILVVMEDALAHTSLMLNQPNAPVLILVVMEDALAQIVTLRSRDGWQS